MSAKVTMGKLLHDLPATIHTALCHLPAQHSHANVSSLVSIGLVHNM